MSDIYPVAHIYTEFRSKFGIPRQAGLVDTKGKIIFEKEFRSPDAIRGLENFSHLWLIWEFSENKNKSSSLTVRPPRLGGNRRMGVFATRSSFRPNNLGLSCVKIEKIDYECENAPVIYISGADILDATPVFDIKPYLPFSDMKPDARGGFADEVCKDGLSVLFEDGTTDILTENEKEVLTKILSQDPRPHYHTDENRLYAFEYSRYKIKFTVKDNILTVKEITVF